LPFLAHSTIEPLNCVAKVSKNSAELWYACQMQTIDRQEVAAATGIPLENVSIHTLYSGGSFGRRASPNEYVMDAVAIAKQVPDRPVKMVWTREDDMRNGKYRPMSVHRLRGAVSPEGKLTAWEHHAVAQPIRRGTPFEAFIRGPVDGTLVEGISDMPYDIPNLLVQATEMKVAVSTLWWRSVGHSGHAFVVESFIDQLANAAKQDPVVFRRNLLGQHPRYLGVLNLAAEQAGWDKPLAKGRGRGIAVHKAMGSWCAQVAEVTVAEDGSFSVDRFVCAIDCGIAVNPDVIRAQMEGSIGFGLSAALGEAITLKEGAVVENNFNNYSLLRIDQMPTIDVHIVASAEPPSGVGEPGVPPVPAALANALRAASGRNIFSLPIGKKV
jgi:isoquinoline 1-oxidoreductase beta subunit